MNEKLDRIDELEGKLKAKNLTAICCTVSSLIMVISLYFYISTDAVFNDGADAGFITIIAAALLVVYLLFAFKYVKTKLAIEAELASLRENL